MSLFIRWLVGGLSMLAVGYLVPGIEVEGFLYALLAAAVLGVLNAVVRPVLILLTLPLTVFTLGFFIFVINALLMWLMSGVLDGIHIDGFWSALIGTIVLTVINGLINWLSADRPQSRPPSDDTIDLNAGSDGKWS